MFLFPLSFPLTQNPQYLLRAKKNPFPWCRCPKKICSESRSVRLTRFEASHSIWFLFIFFLTLFFTSKRLRALRPKNAKAIRDQVCWTQSTESILYIMAERRTKPCKILAGIGKGERRAMKDLICSATKDRVRDNVDFTFQRIGGEKKVTMLEGYSLLSS